MSISFFIMAVIVMSVVAQENILDYGLEDVCVSIMILPEYCKNHCPNREKRHPKDVVGMKESSALKAKNVLMKKSACVGNVRTCCCGEDKPTSGCGENLVNYCRCNGFEHENIIVS